MKNLFILLLVVMTNVSSFSQDTNYEVYALRYATTKDRLPLSALVMDGPEKEYMDAIFMIWLIKGDKGRNILVDAGFLKDVEEAREFNIKDFTRPDSILAGLGLRAEDITDIIVTHPHWDHIDGISLFPNAHIWIQKEDFNYFVGDAWQKNAEHGGFNKRDVKNIIEANLSGKLTLVDGDDKEIIPGIKVYTGSRHTFNSQYVLVNSGPDRIIIASDNMYTYYNLEHLKSAPKGATFDPVGYVNSMKRMKSLASNEKYIIPGHDGLLFTKFPKISGDIIRIK